MFKKLNKKGFTLAELLVVVAIIGVLVAISIPIFTAQLEKARDAVSIANIRSAYAEAQTAVLTKTTSDSDFDGNVKYTAATDSVGPKVEVKGVAIKSQKANKWSDLANELPFITDSGDTSLNKINELDAAGVLGESCTITFEYDGTSFGITKVTLVKTTN